MNKVAYGNIKVVGKLEIAPGGNAYWKECGTSYCVNESLDVEYMVAKTIRWGSCHCYGNSSYMVRRENRTA